jgi:tRNA A-37 threonylcarbamoyl transferase component Bud32
MEEAKNTARATVRIGYDGKVHKTFRGPLARERYEHEIRVLRYLEKARCPFVPRVLETHDEEMRLVTSNCGARVQQPITPDKLLQLFADLEQYGVRHDDPYQRNVTYRAGDGRFCLIDFEFATILESPHLGPPPPPPEGPAE